MNKLFIDTNAFFQLKYSFNTSQIIEALIKTTKDKNLEYNNLSVIDNEIIADIKEICQKEKSVVNDIGWIKNYLKENIINDNCFKKLTDYTNFKKLIKAVDCDVSKINPEIVLKQYFDVQLPFELNSEKRKEFPDAFISTYVNNLITESDEKIYFITDDGGLAKSLNDNVIIYKDLYDFLSSMNGILPKEEKRILSYLNNNLILLNKLILEKASIQTYGLEQEEINIESISIDEINSIQVVNKQDNKFVIRCKCNSLDLNGEFMCFDYENSYKSNDSNYYITEEYILVNGLTISNYEFLIILKKEKDKYEVEIDKENDIVITYNDMLKVNYEYLDYCVESYLNRDWHDEYR